MLLKDKIALVTGASRGIGKAIALELAKQGAIVVGTATSDKGADVISTYLKDAGYEGQGFCLNVTDPESIQAFLDNVKNTVGECDILINNAAVTNDNLMLRMKEYEWDNVINTNLNSVFRMTKAVLRGMVKKRWGRIVSIGSVVGSTGNLGQANYSAAKAGVIGFSKSVAIEVASRNVTVNVVAPGFVETDMTDALPDAHKEALLDIIPMKRIGQPEEIAHAVSFLCSDCANYITGHVLHVNGGMHMA